MACARARGFTLVEMLAVTVIVAIALTATAVGVSQGLAAARIRAASVEVAAALRATRVQAIVRARPQAFELDTRRHSWSIPGHAARPLPRGLRVAITSAAIDAPDAVTGRIRFFPDGSSTGGRITLAGNRRSWRIDVSWLTGEVRVRDTVAAP